MRNQLHRWAVMLILSTVALPAMAKAPPEEVAKLGKELTPVGAQRAGNDDGTIPEWTPAEQAGPLKGFWPSNPQVEAEKPLFSITAQNMAQYAGKLTEGHKELLKRYPDSYRMDVYPSHRSATFPQEVLDASIRNASTASLPDVDRPEGATLGLPFPIPQSGAEPIWNHKMKYRGVAGRRYNNQMIVQLDGKFTLTKIIEDVKFYYGNPKIDPPLELKPGIPLIKYVSEIVSPPRMAGTFIVAHEKAGTGPEGRAAWLYAPAIKRIRRAPAVCCDNPYEGTDGHQFYDQVDMFNGVLERYTWKLLGKREMYIPYNSYRISGNKIKYADIAHPKHVNPDLPRYELHRVWVVEAENLPNLRHTFKRIHFYLDEDSWNIVARDNYDHQDQLMQLQEGHLIFATNVLTTATVPEVIYHFNSGRYFVTAMANEDQPIDASVDYDDIYFEASSVQQRVAK
ncbi:DUF1329 domain-containing protein [Algiphilus sp. W345]|uniref:DUF1329 domain-containing protein n=1 Tax=Banduia mediterranea TaxID=3075609 RepID=A0ABU2WFB0_9GAMM|nr:DUF1329 domain-containing protein [Algiphilus sp. W345]MDT0496213.1 DUF1329 domain-containing protein [Algiphilus sp. W345]